VGGGLVQVESGDGGLEAGGILIEPDANFGSSGEPCGKDESDDGCNGRDTAKNPLRSGIMDHEAESEEGEGEPEAEELSYESAGAIDRWIFIEAHRCTNNRCNRKESG